MSGALASCESMVLCLLDPAVDFEAIKLQLQAGDRVGLLAIMGVNHPRVQHQAGVERITSNRN